MRRCARRAVRAVRAVRRKELIGAAAPEPPRCRRRDASLIVSPSLSEYISLTMVVCGAPKTIACAAAERPPRAPLTARCGRQVAGMSVHGRRALEPANLEPWLASTVRRHSEAA